jgi:hypothetical protein
MFLGLPDPDPLVRGLDSDPDPAPDPSIVRNSKKNLGSYCFVTFFGLFIGAGSGSVYLINGSGRPKNIWILRIRIHNTDDIYGLVWFQGSEAACTGPTWSLQSWRKSSRTTAKAFSHSRRGAEALSSRKRLQTRAVLRIRIRDPVSF